LNEKATDLLSPYVTFSIPAVCQWQSQEGHPVRIASVIQKIPCLQRGMSRPWVGNCIDVKRLFCSYLQMPDVWRLNWIQFW